MDAALEIEAKDFMLDEKRLERFSLSNSVRVRLSFNFELIKSGNLQQEINAVFKSTLTGFVLDKSNEDDEKIAELYVEMQVASYVKNIESIDFESLTTDQEDCILAALYPLCRNVIADDFPFIKLDHNTLPYSLGTNTLSKQ